jgi:predicted ATP-dependent endonuclease of OLD family
MFIKSLQLSNFQTVRDFDADFEGGVYFITGDNELGKSTILKAIGVMLTGERDAVLTNGEEKGFGKMVVGDDGENYDVDLRFSKANPRGSLSIKTRSTGMKSDNISMLTKIFGYTDFDAVEFSRWSETAEGRRKQIEVVKSLLPKEVQDRIATIDKDVVTKKELRKTANTELRTYTSICDAAEKEIKPGDEKKYAKPIEVKDLLAKQSENAQLIEKAKTVREKIALRKEQLQAIPTRIKSAKDSHKTISESLKS